ncbi:sulfotransferase family 2 domain-containing protein [Pleurocapsa sp. PCC 7319]|uniref:sulfotransferase family 2 domain-containing protein n=1 Tax=Pleurocapsa sp. PCC 7319 TaxID=118161 RepID=UPI000348B57A|nr:sulfotransferase family 2 domain-containing protein [Pleurocapsa sp. PCC 7319]
MIISHSKKFIFVHIQKTAGTAITIYLDKYLNYQDLIIGSTEFGENIQPFFKKKFRLHKHSYAKRIKSVTGDEVWNNYFSFSLVRNPWDRMVSLYNWCCKGKYKFSICEEAIKAGSFSQFIRGECFQSLPQQIEYITDNKGNILVDFIGKQESIQEDFDYVCEQLQLPCTDMQKFKHNVRKRSHDNYQSYYNSDKDIDIVKNKFAADIDIFEYKF